MSKRKITGFGDTKEAQPKRPSSGFWANKLIDSMEDPELKVMETTSIVVIKDKYPKAKHHYLILPKRSISSILEIKPEDISLLLELEDLAKQIIATTNLSYKMFNIGYHAIPSMQRLHLHVISRDFNSPCLKTKEHWNSFTTEFFIPAEKLRQELEASGELKTLSKSLRNAKNVPLKCHVCDELPKNMPALKRHIISHESFIASKVI